MRRAVLAAVTPLLLALAGCSSSEPPTGTSPSVRVSTTTETGTLEAEPTEGPTGATSTEAPEPVGDQATVTRVIDGDTIEVALDGETVDVRLIGIDTPETVDPSEPVECYGPAASRFTTKMLDGQEVRLEFDVERLDRYGRTLAYVWLGDELFNEVLVRRGFATVSTYPPNVKYVDEFTAAQREARSNLRGFWGALCRLGINLGGGGGGAGGGGGGNCDPSYPDVCIPTYPPDLDCGQVVVHEQPRRRIGPSRVRRRQRWGRV